MIGPVLYLELLLGARRSRQYVFRWIYAGWLVVVIGFWFISYYFFQMINQSWIDPNRFHPDTTAEYCSSFVAFFLVQQLILMLLATPAFVAGAVTDEKIRGTLQHMLTADLTAWEIVVGKLLGRSLQVVVLGLTGVPVLCFFGVFCGMSLFTLMAVLLLTVVPLFAVASASMLASVWSRQTREAVLALYTIGGVAYALVWGSHEINGYLKGSGRTIAVWLGWIPDWVALLDGMLQYFNPLFILEPAWGAANLEEFGRRLFWSMFSWSLLGFICFGLSVWRLRSAYIRQLEGSGAKKKEAWWRVRRPPVTDEPIRWKERYVEGMAPLKMLRFIPRWLAVLVIFLVATLVSLIGLVNNLPIGMTLAEVFRMIGALDTAGLGSVLLKMQAGDHFFWMGVAASLLGSLAVGIRCSGAISGEREQQSWEALLLTPLETKQLIRAKLFGVLWAMVPYLLAFAIPAMLLSCLGGIEAAYRTLQFLMFTVVSMWLVGAAGVWCSVFFTTSWRSLLGTLGVGYVGGALMAVVVSPVIFFVAIFVWIILMVIDAILNQNNTGMVGIANFINIMTTAGNIVLAGIFYGIGWYLLLDAEKRVADRERTRHWKDEPLYRPRRRRRPMVARPRYYK